MKDKMGGNHMDIEDMIVDLNDLTQDGVIECPYCHKGKTYTYSAKAKNQVIVIYADDWCCGILIR